MKKISLLIAFVFLYIFSFSQDVILDASSNGTTVEQCDGNFYDSGGSSDDYENNADDTITICSGSSAHIRLTFSSFATEKDYDTLYIYNGISANNDSLIGWYSGSDGPGIITSSNTCLTIVFHSDGSGTDNGWAASIECFYPCQLIQIGWDGSTPTDSSGYIDVCQDDATVTFSAHGVYPENDTYYHQSDATSTFVWDFGDDSTATGKSVTHTFPAGGGYDIKLIITDSNNCVNTDDLGIRVRESTTPVFTGTNISDDTICTGDTVDLTGVVTPTPWEKLPRKQLTDTTFLPDGNGTSYTTDLVFTDFDPGQTITDANSDILSICLNMEHSYLGDLSISITCPSGQEMVILDYNNNNGGGTFLGEPIAAGLPVDDSTDNHDPGIGYDYCFEPTSTNGHIDDDTNWTTLDTYTDAEGHTSESSGGLLGDSLHQVPAGSYQIDKNSNWSDLNGCLLNGTWTITVTDNLDKDNGYVFSWGIAFDPNIYPGLWGFTPNVVNETWSGNGILAGGNPTTASPTSTGPQTYTYTITDDLGCSYDTSITINVVGIDIDSDAATDLSCHGDNSGNATVTISGNNPPYTYDWSNNTSNNTSDTTNTITGLSGGDYIVTITDQGGCSNFDTITVNEPTAITTTTSHQNVTCNGDNNGSATVSASGGTVSGNYTYHWQGGQSTSTITGLTAGTYNVTVSDDNNCTTTESITVSEPNQLEAKVDSKDVTCNGANNGSATATITQESTPPYDYEWSSGDKTLNTNSTTDNVSGLAPGDYHLTITDNNGCNVVIDFSITQPSAFSVSQDHDNASCGHSDGDASVSVSGATPGYTYSWNDTTVTADSITNIPAGTYIVTITDANSCTHIETINVEDEGAPTIEITSTTNISCNGACDGSAIATITTTTTGPYDYVWTGGSATNNTDATTDTATGLCAGIITVTVTDNLGCRATDNVLLTQPTELTTTVDHNDVSCNGGSDGVAMVSASGGTSPYTYTWNTSPTQTTDTATGLTAGTYSVTVIDAHDCSTIDSVTIDEPTPLVLSTSTVNSTNYQANGSATVSASGGTPPYNYHWSNDQYTATDTGLTAGTYTVTVTDDNGCYEIDSVTIDNMVNPLIVTITPDQDICIGESATIHVSVSGGDGGPYTFVWGDSAIVTTDSSLTVSPDTTTEYIVTVHDNSGTPPASDSTHVYVHEPPRLISLSGASGCQPVSVFFEPTIYQSDLPTTYLWNFGDNTQTSNDSTPTHTYQNAGSYDVTLTLTSSYGCSTDTTLANLIRVYPIPNAQFQASPQITSILEPTIYFFDESTPTIDHWQWSFGDTSNTSLDSVQNPHHTYANVGEYIVQLIATANSCSDTALKTVTIEQQQTFYPPTAFAPGSDYNGYWYPKGIGINPEYYHLWIYNRWGQVIFETVEYPKGTEKYEVEKGGWNGRYNNTGELVPPDTYTWMLILRDVNGKEHQYLGKVTILK